MIELAAIITGAQAMGMPGLGSVLTAVSGYENEQTKALNVVRKDVRGLVMQNYLTGLDYLRSATRNEVDAEQSQRFLESGVRSLRKASGVFEGNGDHYLASSTAMYLASTYATVGPEREARHWAERAHQEAILAAEDAVDLANVRMDARAGRVSLLSSTGAALVIVTLLVYEVVGLIVEVPHSYFGVRLISVVFVVLAFMGVRFAARNVISFLMFPRLRSWMAFVDTTREVCAAIVGPQSPLPKCKLSLVSVSGTPLEYVIVRLGGQ